MSFAERIKKDKKYRNTVILIFIGIVLLIGNYQGSAKKEAALQSNCNLANKIPAGYVECDDWLYLDGTCMAHSVLPIPGYLVDEDRILCTGMGCNIGRQVDSTGVERYDAYGCFSRVPAGLRAQSKDACSSLDGIKDTYKGGYDFICKASENPDDPNQPSESALCINDAEKTIAGFLDPASFADDYTCKQKFYLVSFAGGFLALILTLSMI